MKLCNAKVGSFNRIIILEFFLSSHLRRDEGQVLCRYNLVRINILVTKSASQFPMSHMERVS
jgi:hypothetical protein